MLIERLHHVAVTVQNVDRAKAFYEAVFELEPRRRLTERVSANRGAWYQLGELEVHLQERAEAQAKTEQHFALLTSDLDEVVRRVLKHGGRDENAKLIEGVSKRHFVYDLDDNRIELLQL